MRPTSLRRRIACAVGQPANPAHCVARRHVTAIFSILMRLRQAVLHPSLVLKRLKENLRAQGIKRAVADSELADEHEDVAIERLIERYMRGAKSGKEAEKAIEELLEPKGEVEGEGECMLCMEVRPCSPSRVGCGGPSGRC